MTAPAKAVSTTTTHGGTFQNWSRPNAASAREKSTGRRIVLVQIGSYSAASSSPTTAAFTPRRAAWAPARDRSASQNGRAPTTSKNEGKNTASSASRAPAQPFG